MSVASDESESFGEFKELEDAFKAQFDLAEQQLDEVLAETSDLVDDSPVPLVGGTDRSDAAEGTATQVLAEWAWPATRSAQEKYLRQLRLTAETLASHRAVVAKVIDVCLRVADVDAGKVATCGSMGKGTASPSSADVDLVVFIDWLDPCDINDELPGLLDEIQSSIEAEYASAQATRRRGKFSIKYIINNIEVSIWIGVQNVRPTDFLDVKSAERREYLKASVLPLAAKLMKRQNDLFHNMVRLVRQWRDSFTWELDCKPSSYLLEVLVLEAFRRHRLCNINTGKTNKHSYPRFAHKILVSFFEIVGSVDVDTALTEPKYSADNLPPVFVYFGGQYTKDQIPIQASRPLFEDESIADIGNSRSSDTDNSEDARMGKPRFARAIVMDPVNPTVNLWLELLDPTSFVVRARQETKALEEKAADSKEPSPSDQNGSKNDGSDGSTNVKDDKEHSADGHNGRENGEGSDEKSTSQNNTADNAGTTPTRKGRNRSRRGKTMADKDRTAAREDGGNNLARDSNSGADSTTTSG